MRNPGFPVSNPRRHQLAGPWCQGEGGDIHHIVIVLLLPLPQDQRFPVREPQFGESGGGRRIGRHGSGGRRRGEVSQTVFFYFIGNALACSYSNKIFFVGTPAIPSRFQNGMFLIPESVFELPLSLYRSRIFLSSAEWVFLPFLTKQGSPQS